MYAADVIIILCLLDGIWAYNTSRPVALKIETIITMKKYIAGIEESLIYAL